MTDVYQKRGRGRGRRGATKRRLHTDNHAGELEALSDGLSVNLVGKVRKAYKAREFL